MSVTGSKYLLEVDRQRILIDCGLYQERSLRGRNWESLPVAPDTIDAVVLTHAHLDHCGLLPKFVRDGFRGRIYCTPATADLVRIMLIDSAAIQEEDAVFKRKRHEREGRKGPHPEVPLYTQQEARETLSLLRPLPYGQLLKIGRHVEVTLHDAGHVLGSSIVRVAIRQKGQSRVLLFSGDLGRWDQLILPDPTCFDAADYVLVESTYGDRLHDKSQDVDIALEDVINSTARAGGNIVIPSFALERSQELLFRMKRLMNQKRIPRLMVFLDSPMAIQITDVFDRYPDLLNDTARQLLAAGDSPFSFPTLKTIRTPDESKAINLMRGTVVVIAGSGMCTGGRIKHHLVNNITRRESTVLFVGYQAADTLGRQIVDGNANVRILGQMYPVKARIMQLTGLSSHADRDELFRWLSGLRLAPRSVFVVHGEPASAQAFEDFVRSKKGWRVALPSYGDEFVIE